MAINYGKLPAKMTPRGVLKANLGVSGPLNSDYEALINKPQINGNELFGNKTNAELGIPTELADLTEDEEHRSVTDEQIGGWNAKSEFSGSWNDLADVPEDLVEDSDYVHTDNNYDDTAKDAVDSLGTASTKNVPSSGNAGNDEVVLGNDTRLSDARPASDVSSWAKASTKPSYTASEVGAIASAAKGTANGVAELDANGKVPSAQLPSYVDDVLEYTSASAFPATGESGKIYIAIDTNKTYRWSGTTYTEISESLALGETASTAYAGNKGKANADAIAAIKDSSSIDSFGDVETALGNKIDKVPGKGLSTNDYDATAKGIVDSVTANLATKVDKVAGKGLSTNDYDNTAKGIVDGVTNALAGKVDKVDGKGLSTNDYDNTAKGIVDGVTNALAGKADKSEMSVTDGTGADADKTTIQLKSGTSTTVLKTHQDISGKADKVSGATNGNLAGLDANGNLTDSGVAKTDIDDMQDELSTDSATATGNPINFSTKSAQNAVSTIIDLEPIQDLHGYDKPWVGGAGKNKWNGKFVNTGFSAEYSTWNTNLCAGNLAMPIKVGTQYTFSINGTATTIRYAFLDANKDLVTNLTNATTTVPAPSNAVYLRWRQYDIPTAEPTLCQLEEGLTATSYAPYENLCPISGRSEIGIEGCGKNLLQTYGRIESTEVNSGKWVVNIDGTITVSGTPTGNSYPTNSARANVSGYTGTLHLSGLADVTNVIYDNISFANADASEVYYNITPSGSWSNDVNIVMSNYVLPSEVYLYVRPKRRANNVAMSGTIKFQLEVGETATAYEPYTKSTDLTISLGQTVYGGSLDVEKGVLTVNKAHKDLGTLSWNSSASFYASISDMSSSSSKSGLCSNYPVVQAGSFVDKTASVNYSDNLIRVKDSAYSSATDFKTAMDGVDFVYELATPTVIQLTPHQISLLEGVNNISTTGDKITLTYRDGKVATLGDLLEVEKKIPSATAQHNYSTEEQVIGTWIDGKPIYEKTYELASDLSLIQDDWKDTPIQKGDIDKIISNETLHSSSTQWGFISARVTNNSNYVQLFNSRSSSISIRYITIRYTKTTD